MRLARLVLALVVVAAVAWTISRLDWTLFTAELRAARPLPLLAAAVLVVLPLGLRSARARMLLARVGHPDLPATRVAAVTVFGFSLSSLTPGGSGDLLRVEALRPYGVAPSLSTALVLYERGLDVLVMAALLGVALAVSWLPGTAAAASIGVGVAAAATLGIVFAARPPPLERWIARAPERLRRWLPDPVAVAPLLEPAVVGRALATTALVFVTEALRPWLVMISLGVDAGPFEAWAIFTLAWGAGLISMLPLGVGSWEAAAVWAFALYGVDPSTGAAGAVLLRAGVTLPALIAGAVSLLWLRGAAEEQA